ncbi:acyltransferase family protein [Phenylobacterium sp.]|jgi:peptidoglycan/LPS O-acetylase OafA/YrhL|uniref:acyltransferase family protein n=1 Tax=Phenylobacterium sp. TaxID=1871053 RepID=UPI002F3F2289
MAVETGGQAQHRRDIDGLRAIAVLAIVAYHAVPGWVRGGFVGVDVFFVISGFLITGIIARGRDEGRFSYRGFYLRRARRIVPAYLVALAATAAAALAILLPQALAPVGWALSASGLFLTNVLGLFSFGYFAPGSQTNPLLHLWSLGVEEQFYLVWPLLVALLSIGVLRRARAGVAVVLMLALLALAQVLVAGGRETFAFFMLPTRAWEFLMGGVLALGLAPPPRGPAAANLAGGLGLALILGSVALLSDTAPFPGLTALPACLGTALVIWSGLSARPAATGVLESRPVVGIGLISYSFYLWHWPVLVLARAALQRDLAPAEALGLAAVSAGLAWLSWRFVEQPWRGRPMPQAPGRALALTLSPLLLFVALGGLILATGGLPQRLSPAVRRAAAFAGTDINPRRVECFTQIKGVAPVGCRYGAAPNATDYDVLVWGDSHADAITPGVVAWAQAKGWSVREATHGGCPPLVDARTTRVRFGALPGCAESNRQALAEIAQDPKLKLIVLSARWPIYNGDAPKYDPHNPPIRMFDAGAAGDRIYPLDEALRRTLATLAATGTKAQILLVGPVPELTFSPPDCIAMARHLGGAEQRCWDAPARLPMIRARAAEAEIAAALARAPEVKPVYPAQRLCARQTCVTVLQRKILYFDADHLSATGARMLVPGWLDDALAGRP